MSVFAEIRDDERRSAIGAFLTLFGIIASHTILETARDALFLARLPAAQLPWVYLVMAAAAVALGQIPARRLQGMFGPSGLSASLGLMSGLTALFWALPDLGHSDWGLRALYVWNGLVATISVLQFWLVLGEIFTITEAKRVYRFVGIGSLLGAVAGAVIARVVSAQLGAPRLIPAAALLMALTALGPALLLRRAQPGAGGPPLALRWTLAEARDLIATQPYVTRLAGLVLVSTVAVTLGDFVFKSTVARHVPAEELGQFFATFYMALNFLALLAQLVLMGWLLRTVGLHRALWTLPILLFLGASGVAVGGGLAAALLLKGADGALRYSVHRTGTELLFLPIPDALRARVKPVIDVFGQRGGQAIASLLILSELGLGRGDLSLAAIAALLCVVWIAAAAEMIPHYVQMFRQALREGMITDRGGLPELDLNSLEALFAGLNSDDDVEVIASLDLLLAEGRGGLIPALILYHPSRRVVLRALEVFETTGRKDFVALADRLLEHEDPEVRAAALRARTMARPEQAVLRRALDDESPLVRATAAVNLVASGWASEGAQTLIAPLLASGLPVGRRALARAIERRPAPEFDKTLLQLSLSSEVDVQVSVANALGALKDERALGTLLAMLARHEVRAAAGSAIVRYGAVGLQFLDEALADTSYPQELRRQIPRTIRRLPAKDAARVLLKHMLGEQDGMVRFKILRALNRLAADNPSVALDRGVLKEAVRRTLGVVFSLAHWRHLLASGADERRATAGHELLASLVRDKQAHATERLFRLLGLLYRSENFESIHRGVLSSSPRLRASSRELLEAVLRSPLREALLAVVDGAPWPQSAPVAAPYYRAAATGYEELLTSLLGSPSESLRCLAAHHIAELGLRSLRPAIEAQRARESALFVEQVLAKALRTLEPALGYAR
jgi:ATP/ADP translocase